MYSAEKQKKGYRCIAKQNKRQNIACIAPAFITISKRWNDKRVTRKDEEDNDYTKEVSVLPHDS